MRKTSKLLILAFVFMAFILISVNCTGQEVEPAVAENTVTAPEQVIVVPDAVLDFLRDGANICVPPEGVVWQTSYGDELTPVGFEMVRFRTSDDYTVTVTCPQNQGDDTVYHVALGHGVTGFCWQALVDRQGHVVQTGAAANSSTQIGNPAKTYCEAQVYHYQVVTTAAGMECGQCVFSDGSRCNGWAYLNNACQPDNNPAEDG